MSRRKKSILFALLRAILAGVVALSIFAVALVVVQRIVGSGDRKVSSAPTAQTTQSAPAAAATAGATLSAPLPTGAPTPDPTPTPAPSPTPEPTPVAILLSAVGDCTLGGDANSGTIARFERYAEEYGYDYYFANVADIFLADDVTVVNLEGPLTTATTKRADRQFSFKGSPENVRILTGVEACGFANNHAQDFLNQGILDTKDAVEGAGMGFFIGKEVYYRETNGVTMGFLGVTQWNYSVDEVTSMVKSARENCDILIVAIHWGEERQYKVSAIQDKYGKAIIDAGADLVLGSHSHVIGAVRQYKGKYIVYNMGNFCFGGNRNPADKNCYIFQQRFIVSPDGTISDGGINIIPCTVSSVADKNDFRPTPVTGKLAESILRDIAKYSEADLTQYTWMDGFIGYELGLVTK